MESYWDNLLSHQYDGGISVYEQLRYRCEQSVTTYLNDVPASNVQTKADYILQGVEDVEGNKAYDLKITENIVSIFPEQFTEAAKMMGDLEKIKSDVVLLINAETGTPKGILNYKEIIDRWEDYKFGIKEKYEFLKDKQTRDSLDDFLNIVDKQIRDKETLLSELRMKLPFLLLFDKHLVSSEILPCTEWQEFSSPLFDQVNFPLELRQEIEKETPSEVMFVRHGTTTNIPQSALDSIEDIYDQKFKPAVGYSFSTYCAGYDMRYLVDKECKSLREAQGCITEEVVNNVRLTINFTLKKIQ